jgi:hypothetical protein
VDIGPSSGSEPRSSVEHVSSAGAARLREALEVFDEPGAQLAFEEALAKVGLEELLDSVVLPYLHDLGDRWERFEVSIAQEHFASQILRTQLMALARGWSSGSGPQAVLACPPAEHHDLASIIFGLALRRHGWRIHLLGADTPVGEAGEAAAAVGADVIVFSGAMPHTLYAVAAELVCLGRDHRVAIGGIAARPFHAAGERLIVLDGAVVAEAKRLPQIMALS